MAKRWALNRIVISLMPAAINLFQLYANVGLCFKIPLINKYIRWVTIFKKAKFRTVHDYFS